MIKKPGNSMEMYRKYMVLLSVSERKQLETPRKIKGCMRISWFKYKVN